MDKKEPDVWKYLDECGKSEENEAKKKERLRKARTFCGRGRNTLGVTDLGVHLPEGSPLPESIPLPPSSGPIHYPPLPPSEPTHSVSSAPPLPLMESTAGASKPPAPPPLEACYSNYYAQHQQSPSRFPVHHPIQNQHNNLKQAAFFAYRSQGWFSQTARGLHLAASSSRQLGASSSRQQQPALSDRCDFSSSSRPLYDFRTWQTESKDKLKTGTKVRVLSYNVLAQDLLESNTFLYRDMDPAWLAWKRRWKFLMWEVKHFDPDVVTFQEVQFKRPNYFKSHILPFFEELGYRAIFKCRTGEKNDGCAIFYKKKCFKMEEYSKVEYCKPGDALLNRENIGLVARLVERGAMNSSLIVGTTHLLFNKKRVDVRLAQAALFLAEVDKLRERDGVYSPVIMTGDFNSDTNSPVYELMATGNVQYEGLHAGRRVLTDHLLSPNLGVSQNCQYTGVIKSRESRDASTTTGKAVSGSAPAGGFLRHDLKLESVYGDLETGGVRDPVVTTNHGDWTVVDYIFFSRALASASQRRMAMTGQLYLTSRLMLPCASNMMEIGRIPSPLCPSDHFPLLADFVLVQDS
jgi:protein angel